MKASKFEGSPLNDSGRNSGSPSCGLGPASGLEETCSTRLQALHQAEHRVFFTLHRADTVFFTHGGSQ